MTQTESDPSIIEAWTENPSATALAIGLGIVIGAGAVIGYDFIRAAGDEPPIRVRNGSIELEVVHKSRYWKEVGSGGTHWKINRGERNSDSYWMYLAPTNTTHCNAAKASGGVIRFILSDDSWVEVKSQNNKTHVTSNKSLTRSDDRKFLRYGDGALYIKLIQLDGSNQCTFAAKDANLHSLLTE
jgi:hypothetical protein